MFDAFKNLGNLGEMLKQARQMQEKMAEMQAELARKQVTADAGAGMVEATVNGKQELVKIRIDKQKIDVNDTDMLEEMIVSAVQSAQAKAQEMMKEEMQEDGGGFGFAAWVAAVRRRQGSESACEHARYDQIEFHPGVQRNQRNVLLRAFAVQIQLTAKARRSRRNARRRRTDLPFRYGPREVNQASQHSANAANRWHIRAGRFGRHENRNRKKSSPFSAPRKAPPYSVISNSPPAGIS